MYKALFTILLLLSSVVPSLGQWKKLASFPQAIDCIYVVDSGKDANYLAFIGTHGLLLQNHVTIPSYTHIWRTANGGKSWNDVFFVSSSTNFITSSFSFKDSLMGWASCGDHGGSSTTGEGCFKTTDGGITWVNILPKTFSQNSDAVYYQPSTKLLFYSCSGDKSLVSSDEGISWDYLGTDNTHGKGLSGYAFIDSLNGIVTSTALFFPFTLHNYYNTTNGGVTWNSTGIFSQSWQPAAFNKYILAFATGKFRVGDTIYRTNDLGNTWQVVYPFPTFFSMNLVVATDSNSLIVQTERATSKINPLEGFFRSFDEGLSWEHICGPENYGDTRFFVSDYGIWAGDVNANLWYNRTKKANADRLLMEQDNVSRHRALIGQEIPVRFHYPAVAYYEGVDSLSFVVQYSEALSFARDSVADGWQVLRREMTDTTIRFILGRTSSAPPDSASFLLTAYFKGYVARAKTATLTLDEINFNQDTTYRECMVASLKRTDSFFIDLQDGCGDSLLRQFLSSHHGLRLISLSPNPATGVIFVNIETPESQTVQFEIVNTLGIVISTRSQMLNPGTNSVTLITQDLPSGLYFLRMRGLYETINATFQRQ